MMNSSGGNTHNKVSQVFAAAGQAFTRLGELTMHLHVQHEALPGSKWTDEEVDMLRKAVQQFGNNLEKVSECIKTRTMSQVKHAIKRKVYSEAGMPLSNQKQSPKNQAKKRPAPVTPQNASTMKTGKGGFATPGSVVLPKKAKLGNDVYNNNGVGATVEVSESAVIKGEAPSDSIVDVENLDESTTSLKKIDQFISSQPSLDVRTPGGVAESAVSNPPPLPPLDLVSEQT